MAGNPFIFVEIKEITSETVEAPSAIVVVYADGKENGGGIVEVVVCVAGNPLTFVEIKEITSETVEAPSTTVVVYAVGKEKGDT